MKKIILSTIMLVIINISIVFAFTNLQETNTIATAIESINNNIEENNFLLIANSKDEGAFVAIFQSLFMNSIIEKELSGEFMKFTSDIEDNENLDNKNLIIVGGPCVNKFWNIYSTETCENWPYTEGESIIKLVKDKGKNILLIAGTSKDDTWSVTQKLINYKDNNLFNTDNYILKSKVSKNTDEYNCNNKTTCINFYYNAKENFTYENKEYVFVLKEIKEESKKVIILINNEQFDIEIGEKLKLTDDLIMIPKIIGHDLASGKANNVLFYFNKRVTKLSDFNKGVSSSGVYIGINERNLIYPDNTNIPVDHKILEYKNKLIKLKLNDKIYRDVSINQKIKVNDKYNFVITDIQEEKERDLTRLTDEQLNSGDTEDAFTGNILVFFKVNVIES